MLDYVNGDMKLARSCSAMKPDQLCVLHGYVLDIMHLIAIGVSETPELHR